MPKKFHNIRQNFSVGVLSPRLSARTDADQFKNALKTAKNWIISSQGGAVMREGLQFVDYSANNAPFRLFQFLRGGEQSDMLIEVSAGITRFWVDELEPELYVDNVTILSDEDDGELLIDEDGEFLSIGAVTVQNPYQSEDLDTLYFINQDKFGIICSANHPPMYITIRKDGVVVNELFPKERIPFFDYNDTSSPKLLSELSTWRLNFPAGWLSSNFIYYPTYDTVYPGEFSGWSQVAETNRASLELLLNQSISAQGLSTVATVSIVDGDIGSYDVTLAGEDAGKPVDLYLSAGYMGGVSSAAGYSPIQMPPLSQSSDSDVGPEAAWSYPMWVLHNSRYWRCIRTHRASAESEPYAGTDWELYWAYEGAEKPAGFDYQFPTGNDWSLLDGEGEPHLYSPMDRGFPTVAAFHQQRLLFMANKDNPTAIYGSGINAYQDFLVGANDDEAWMFVLDSTDSPQIKWAISDRQLVIGTSSGEWVITAEVTITPSDIQAQRQNASRSHLTKPIQVDTEIIYIEQGQRKLRSSSYERRRGSFVSQNISMASEHLVSTNGIKRLAIQHIPEVMITAVTNDGQLVTMSYESLGNQAITQAFTEQTTDANINDVASYFSFERNREYAYFAVERNGNWLIEKMRYPTSKEQLPMTSRGIVMMDSWTTGELLNINGEMFALGLDHLNGKLVHMLVDDAWVDIPQEVSNGKIILPEEFQGTFAVGVPYMQLEDGEYAYADLETFEVDDNFRGTGMGAKRRWNSLTTRLLNSSLPKIYGFRDRDRTPATNMNTHESVRDGLQDIEQSVQGYGNGSIRVIQDRPYPTHIVAFFGEYQVEDR